MDLRTVNVTRYIMPLREGGSLPALAEADDDFKYVVKFREQATDPRRLSLTDRWRNSPCPSFPRTRNRLSATGRSIWPDRSRWRDTRLVAMEPWAESRTSFLVGRTDFWPHRTSGRRTNRFTSSMAGRSAHQRRPYIKNTNMLMWHKELWLIDHGAALYFHHSWETGRNRLSILF